MIRVLIMIAVAGFILALASLSAAIAVGGPEALSRGGWMIATDDDWHMGWRDHHHRGRLGGPEVTRTVAWDGADTLHVEAPADVRYTQQAGPVTLTVTGPQRAVERVVVENGRIRLRDGARPSRRLTIIMTAPSITGFDLSGANRLIIEGYRQDRLFLDLSGPTEVTATGETRLLELEMSGPGEANLGRLKTREAEVEISGAGDATVAPTDRAKLDISGIGEVTLLTRPAQLETDVSGAGAIHQAAPGSPPVSERAAGRRT